MHSIFSPRFNVTKGGVVSLRVVKNDKVFDKYYYDPFVKEVCVKTGEKDTDFVIQKKVSFDKRNIREVIESQEGCIPDIDLAIKRFVETGDLTALPPGMEDSKLEDFTQLPEDHADLMIMLQNAEIQYDSLPSDLKKNMTMSEFINKMDNEALVTYFNSIKPKEEEKKDE